MMTVKEKSCPLASRGLFPPRSCLEEVACASPAFDRTKLFLHLPFPQQPIAGPSSTTGHTNPKLAGLTKASHHDPPRLNVPERNHLLHASIHSTNSSRVRSPPSHGKGLLALGKRVLPIPVARIVVYFTQEHSRFHGAPALR